MRHTLGSKPKHNPHKVSGSVKAGKGGHNYSSDRGKGDQNSANRVTKKAAVWKNTTQGTGIDETAHRISRIKGKGPIIQPELSKTRTLSKREFPMGGDHGPDVRAGHAVMTRNMSGKHGQHGGSKDNNMNRLTGGYMIGKKQGEAGRFKPHSYRLAGPKENYPRHGRQPSGHKKQAGPN